MCVCQVKRAYLIKLRYLKKVPAASDGSTGKGFDGYASKYWLGLGVTDLDSESVQEVFMQAASVFNRCVVYLYCVLIRGHTVVKMVDVSFAVVTS